jgi:hypothetical protein
MLEGRGYPFALPGGDGLVSVVPAPVDKALMDWETMDMILTFNATDGEGSVGGLDFGKTEYEIWRAEVCRHFFGFS